MWLYSSYRVACEPWWTSLGLWNDQVSVVDSLLGRVGFLSKKEKLVLNPNFASKISVRCCGLGYDEDFWKFYPLPFKLYHFSPFFPFCFVEFMQLLFRNNLQIHSKNTLASLDLRLVAHFSNSYQWWIFIIYRPIDITSHFWPCSRSIYVKYFL